MVILWVGTFVVRSVERLSIPSGFARASVDVVHLGLILNSVGELAMVKVRFWWWLVVSILVGVLVSACGDESESAGPPSALESESDVAVDGGNDTDETEPADTVTEPVESEPPTACESACYQQYEEMVSAADCDAWCYATADQWLTGCLAECSGS